MTDDEVTSYTAISTITLIYFTFLTRSTFSTVLKLSVDLLTYSNLLSMTVSHHIPLNTPVQQTSTNDCVISSTSIDKM